MSERDDLAQVIYRLTTENTFFDHVELADAIIAAGWKQTPRLTSYVGIDAEEHDRLMRLSARGRS